MLMPVPYTPLSYFGLIRRIESLGGHYPAGQYASQAAILGTLCGLLCYATTEHWFYSAVIASLAVFFLPSFFYMNLKRLAQEKEEKEMLTYVSTAILYIRAVSYTHLDVYKRQELHRGK